MHHTAPFSYACGNAASAFTRSSYVGVALSIFCPSFGVSVRMPFGCPLPVPDTMACSVAFVIASTTLLTRVFSKAESAIVSTSRDTATAQRNLW